MFISYVAVLILCFVEILTKPFREEDRVTTPIIRTDDDRPDNDAGPPPLTSPPPEGCRGDECRPPPNLVGPIVGSLCGILALALIAVFIIWFYLRRKHKKPKELPPPPIHVNSYVEQPPLYTGAISTTDSQSRLYGMSQARNDSIDSHLYEKINYGERS